MPVQEFSGSSPKRRRAEDKDEGIGSPDIWEDEKAEDLRREMIELRQQLDKERSVRMMLEEQVRARRAGPGRLCAGWARPLAGCATAGPEPPRDAGAASAAAALATSAPRLAAGSLLLLGPPHRGGQPVAGGGEGAVPGAGWAPH